MNNKKINERHEIDSSSAMVVFGNKKIPLDHAIVNIVSATDCPSAKLGMCGLANKCYARAEESRWKKTRQCNDNRHEVYNHLSDTEWIGLIRDYIDEYERLKGMPVVAIRIHEAGDFIDQHSVERVNMLAEIMAERNITVYAWTSRTDLDFSNRKFILNASTQKVNSYDRLFLGKPELWVLGRTLNDFEYICPGFCDGCDVCSEKNHIKVVYCKLHGSFKNK